VDIHPGKCSWLCSGQVDIVNIVIDQQNDDKHIQFVRFQDNEHDVFFFDIQVHNDHNDHGIKQSKR